MTSPLMAAALSALLLLGAPVATSAQNPVLQEVMREKLLNAQRLLEAVVRADFPAITRASDRLGRISETEIASWQAVAKPEYTEQVTRFLLSVQGLREAAASRNSRAATEEYSVLVSSCVRCHQNVRDARNVARELPDTRKPAN